MSAPVGPLFDPELDEVLKQSPGIPPFNRENLHEVRKMLSSMNPSEIILSDPELSHKDITIPGPNGLKWVAEHHSELAIDLEKIIVTGASGGGNLAAATTLAARDRGGPKICAQLLCYPVLDDRMDASSYKQFADKGLWRAEHNIAAWDMVLGERRGTTDVSIYEAPARATDLSGLPPTWLDVGSAKLFRDEVVAYASKMWEHGGQVELHVGPGGWHSFDVFAPSSALGKLCLQTRLAWIKRVLAQ